MCRYFQALSESFYWHFLSCLKQGLGINRWVRIHKLPLFIYEVFGVHILTFARKIINPNVQPQLIFRFECLAHSEPSKAMNPCMSMKHTKLRENPFPEPSSTFPVRVWFDQKNRPCLSFVILDVQEREGMLRWKGEGLRQTSRKRREFCKFSAKSPLKCRLPDGFLPFTCVRFPAAHTDSIFVKISVTVSEVRPCPYIALFSGAQFKLYASSNLYSKGFETTTDIFANRPSSGTYFYYILSKYSC